MQGLMEQKEEVEQFQRAEKLENEKSEGMKEADQYFVSNILVK